MKNITSIEVFLKRRKIYREIKAWKSALNNIFKNNRKTVKPILNHSHSLLFKNISLPPPRHLTKTVDPLIGLAGEGLCLALEIEENCRAEQFLSLFNLRRNLIIENIISGRPKSESQILFTYLNALLMLNLDVYLLPLFSKSIENSLMGKLKNYIFSINPELHKSISNEEMRKLLHKRINLFYGKSFHLNSSAELISFNPLIYNALRTACKSALKNAGTVIYGETGTGKETLARFIHQSGMSKDNLFISVKCGALSEGEICRLFEKASEGTLFLDDLWNMPAKSQIELLNAVGQQNHKEEPIPHLIYGSDRNLRDLARQGKFRKDLYFRIHTLSMHLSHLRERQEDIPFLSKLFIARHSDENEEIQISKRAIFSLLEHQWYGNLTEIENVIQRALIIRSNKNIIKMEDIQFLEEPAQSQSHIFSSNNTAIQRTRPDDKHIHSAKITQMTQKTAH